MKQYRVQYAEQHRFADWSEWRDISQAPTEANILSIQFKEALTVEEAKEFFKHFEVV